MVRTRKRYFALLTIWLYIAGISSYSPALSQTKSESDSAGSSSAPAEILPPPRSEQATDNNKDFQKWDEVASEITAALNANEVPRADKLADQLMSDAQKAGTHAALATAYTAKGWVRTYQKQFQPAIEAFNIAMEELQKQGIKPQSVRTVYVRQWLVDCYLWSNQANAALTAAKELVKDDRTSTVAQKWLGEDISRLAQAYFHMQNYSAAGSNAEDACRVLLFSVSTSNRGTKKLLNALQIATESDLMLWKYEEAEHTCRILTALDHLYNGDKSPLGDRILLDLARAQAGCHKYSDAHKTLDTLLVSLKQQSGWPYVAALTVLADLDMQQGNFEDARKTYQQSIDVISGIKSSHFNTPSQATYFDCALAEYHSGHMEAAEKHLAEAAHLDSNPKWTAAALSYLAALYRRTGDDAAARQTIEKFVAVRNRVLNDKLGGSFTDVLTDGKPVAGIANWIVTPVKHVADVNQDIIARLQTGLSFVPAGVKERLRSAGVTIIVVPTMQYLTDDPDARPPGYETGSNTSNEQAHTSAEIGAVVMAERYRPYRGADWVDAPDVSESIRHEIAHALDHYLLQFSDDREFVDAYASDTKDVTPKLKRSLAYVLQPGSHGRRETFASLVALEWGGKHQADELKTQFPHCIEVVKKCLSTLDKPVDKPPPLDPSMSMLQPCANASA